MSRIGGRAQIADLAGASIERASAGHFLGRRPPRHSDLSSSTETQRSTCVFFTAHLPYTPVDIAVLSGEIG